MARKTKDAVYGTTVRIKADVVRAGLLASDQIAQLVDLAAVCDIDLIVMMPGTA